MRTSDGRTVHVRNRTTKDPRYADAWSEFHLRFDAPEWALDAMYRECSKRAHPDVAQDEGEQQRRLNETYRKLKATFR